MSDIIKAIATEDDEPRAVATRDYVETWYAIADAMGKSERWCRYVARRAADPLPVFKVGGIVRMLLADRDEWLERQRVVTVGISHALSGAE